MKRTVHAAARATAERQALRRRVKQFYHRFNQADWSGCRRLLDPQLTRQGKVTLDSYAERMQAFKEVYGSIKLWSTRLSLHLAGAPKQGDRRPFAYVYVVWQDQFHGFHMFRERWIKDNGQWFSRVAGLVPNRRQTGSSSD